MKSRDGWASVFLFGEARGNENLALFGPPPFTVTGLSGGFGVNSTLDRVPAIEEIDQFPFMGRLGGGSGATPSPEAMLEELNQPSGCARVSAARNGSGCRCWPTCEKSGSSRRPRSGCRG